MELQECYEKYVAEFGNGSWLPSEYTDEEVQSAYKTIQSFIEYSFIKLSRSILSGEYMVEPEFNGILKKYIDKVADLSEYETQPDPGEVISQSKNYLFRMFEDFQRSLYNALRKYQCFLSEVDYKYRLNTRKPIYGLYKTFKESRSNILVGFGDFVIPLCRYDYLIYSTSETRQELLHLGKKIKSFKDIVNSNEVTGLCLLLEKKCDFYLKKISSEPFDYEDDFELVTVDPQTLDIGDFVKFESSEKSQGELLEYINQMRVLQRSDSRYKDTLRNMSDLIKKFMCRYKAHKWHDNFSQSKLGESYDIFAWNSVYNYLYNCRFSFIVKNKTDIKLDEICKELHDIEKIQHTTGIKNFHPYEKALDAIITCADTHIRNEDVDEVLMKNKFKELDRILEEYRMSIEWCKSHKFIAFQLPFEESCVYSDTYKLNLFVPSAFMNNENYDRLRESAEKYELRKQFLNILSSVTKEKKEVDNIKNSISETNKKAYDILALFSAAITFLFGTVNIFIANHDKSVLLLICNTMGLGVLLILFMCLYLLVSPVLIQRLNWKEYVKSIRFYLGIIAIIIYMGLTCFLYNRFEYIGSKVEEKERTENVEKASEKEIQIQEPNNIQDKLKE